MNNKFKIWIPILLAIVLILAGTFYYSNSSSLQIKPDNKEIKISNEDGQVLPKLEFWNETLAKIAKPESTPGWIKFKDDANINPKTLFTDYKQAFNLGKDDKMILEETSKDNLGYTLYSYQQYYKNVKIDGATFNVHVNNKGTTYSANGSIISGLNMSVKPSLNSNQVIAIVSINKPSPSLKSELVIRGINASNNNSISKELSFYLVYKIDLQEERVFISAKTGEKLFSFPLVATSTFLPPPQQ